MSRHLFAGMIALLAILYASVSNGQLPEQVQFQPGTFGFGGNHNYISQPYPNQVIKAPAHKARQFLNPAVTPEGVYVFAGPLGHARPMPNSYGVRTLPPGRSGHFVGGRHRGSARFGYTFVDAGWNGWNGWNENTCPCMEMEAATGWSAPALTDVPVPQRPHKAPLPATVELQEDQAPASPTATIPVPTMPEPEVIEAPSFVAPVLEMPAVPVLEEPAFPVETPAFPVEPVPSAPAEVDPFGAF